MTKDEIIEHIMMRDFNEAIDGLKATSTKKNDIILVASRWKGLERDITKGILSMDYAERVKNQIAAALMELAERLPADAPVANNGGGSAGSGAAPNVFISYNHRDKEMANKIKDYLRSKNVEVTIDAEAMKAGEDIKSFIDRCIQDSDVTLSLVSTNSLLSAWVAMESMNTFTGEGIGKKQFIPVSIDSDFFKVSFVRDATKTIDEKLNELKEEIILLMDDDLGFEHLQNDRTRYRDLRNDLPKIVQRLKESLTQDISGDNFEASMEKVVRTITS